MELYVIGNGDPYRDTKFQILVNIIFNIRNSKSINIFMHEKEIPLTYKVPSEKTLQL